MDRASTQGERPLLFVHANGYTPGAYRQLLTRFAPEYQVQTHELLPLQRGAPMTRDWGALANELGRHVDRLASKPVGVGHSLGAVTLLLSAAQRPERYAELVLIEPLAFPVWAAWILRHAPASVRARGPLTRGALQRRDRWANRTEALDSERRRRSLARVPDSVLRDILDDGLSEDGAGQLTLRFSKQWEALLYESPSSVWPVLRAREVALPPVTVIRGGKSLALSKRDLARWRRARPEHTCLEIAEAGHLAPLERPAEVAELVLAQLASSSGRRAPGAARAEPAPAST